MQVIYESLAFALQKQERLEEAIAAYELAYEIKPTENVRNAIEICRQNLAVQKH
jgi:tetratricopeptide (TPR) repeat protein